MPLLSVGSDEYDPPLVCFPNLVQSKARAVQSSASVSLRVGVLLVALVGLPLVAMLDTAILDAGGPPTVANSTRPLDPPGLSLQTVGGQRASAASPRSSMAIAPGRTVARRSTEAPPPVDRPSDRSTVADLADADIRLVTIQRRLRELGASYYLLEKWGTEGQLYRFHCRVAIGEGGGANRHFEAIDASARTTMQQVLAQVEAWRAAQ